MVSNQKSDQIFIQKRRFLKYKTQNYFQKLVSCHESIQSKKRFG